MIWEVDTKYINALKSDIEQRGVEGLPLQQAMTSGGYALDGPIEATILTVNEQDNHIHARVGVFFRSVIAGCNCADDPTPVEPIEEYCELLCVIDTATGQIDITLA